MWFFFFKIGRGREGKGLFEEEVVKWGGILFYMYVITYVTYASECGFAPWKISTVLL